jgi:prepilin-type N-terminal cleavage/methylation domain-containing protein
MRRGFSIIEMLIALSISATLLTATLAALRASFMQYKVTTESASTHVVTRIVMHRMLSMIRTGADFGPFPADVLDSAQNPLTSDFIEFVTQRDILGGISRITRLEYRPGAGGGAGALWYVLLDPALIDPGDPTAAIVEEHMLLSGVQAISFQMQYDIGPRLNRCTIDMMVEPNDSQDIVTGAVTDTTSEGQFIRLIASAAPRQLM